jgi:hypothetical protein
MRPEAIAALVEGGIPFFGGVYATLLGYRLVGKKPGQDARFDERLVKYGRWLRILGPFLVLFGVFAALSGLASNGLSKPLDKNEAVKNLKSQAAEVGNATLKEDHQKLADLTHPIVLEKLGGREKFIEKLKSVAAGIKSEGFRIEKVVFLEPPSLEETNTEVYAVVPFQLNLSGPRGVTITQPAFLIGVSRDSGTNWKFIDGTVFAGDRERLKKLFPNFPPKLKLPDKQPPVRRGA